MISAAGLSMSVERRFRYVLHIIDQSGHDAFRLRDDPAEAAGATHHFTFGSQHAARPSYDPGDLFILRKFARRER